MIHLLAIAGSASRITAQREWSLGFGVNLAIGSMQGGEKEHSAFEALGGSLSVRSPRGQGTELDVALPIPPASDQPVPSS